MCYQQLPLSTLLLPIITNSYHFNIHPQNQYVGHWNKEITADVLLDFLIFIFYSSKLRYLHSEGTYNNFWTDSFENLRKSKLLSHMNIRLCYCDLVENLFFCCVVSSICTDLPSILHSGIGDIFGKWSKLLKTFGIIFQKLIMSPMAEIKTSLMSALLY